MLVRGRVLASHRLFFHLWSRDHPVPSARERTYEAPKAPCRIVLINAAFNVLGACGEQRCGVLRC